MVLFTAIQRPEHLFVKVLIEKVFRTVNCTIL